jgi:hypothetical protein
MSFSFVEGLDPAIARKVPLPADRGCFSLPRILLAFLSDPALWQLAGIPVAAALVGFLANWVAIRMSFRRGILERSAETFAGSTLKRLVTLSELCELIDPRLVAGQILKVVLPRLRRMTDELMLEQDPGLWRAIPELVKQRIYANLEQELPRRIEALAEEAGAGIGELVDFDDLVAGRLKSDPALAERIFYECGRAEFRFLLRSGLVIGFLLGLLQLAIWRVYPLWWTLPLGGAILAYASRRLALAMAGQGVFRERQAAAASWCRIVAAEVLSVRAIVQAMLYGPKKGNTERLIRRHLEPIAWQAVAPFEAGVEMAVGRDRMQAIAALVGRNSLAIAALPFEDWRFNQERSEVVERLLRERLQKSL